VFDAEVAGWLNRCCQCLFVAGNGIAVHECAAVSTSMVRRSLRLRSTRCSGVIDHLFFFGALALGFDVFLAR
jgi:hypothetical protein